MKIFENVELRKTGNNKYELNTQDISLEPKNYKMFLVDGIIIMKPIYYKNTYKPEESQKKDTKTQINNYTICNTDYEAKNLSWKLSKEIKDGKILGIKGFDKKYYIFKAEFYNKIKSTILGILKAREQTTLEDINKTTKTDIEAIKGILEIMKEEGLIYEKDNIIRIVGK